MKENLGTFSLPVCWRADRPNSVMQCTGTYRSMVKVTAYFKVFTVKVESDDVYLTNSRVRFSAEVNSLVSGVEQRDTYWKSAAFLHAQRYPRITFERDGFTPRSGLNVLQGALTIRDTTRSVALRAYYCGTTISAQGVVQANVEVSGTLRRSDFGLYRPSITEEDTAFSDEIHLMINIQLVKK